MKRKRIVVFFLGGVLAALVQAPARATTREIAEFQAARLTFDQSILNQLTYDTYRDPFDEMQTRPYNLLFTNIGRHPTLSPWQGQSGMYTRYVNALIGNNGTANVDNDADTLQGSMIWRTSRSFAWGLSAAYLAGNSSSDDTAGTATFSDSDDLEGFDLRVAAALQISESRILGGGVRVRSASREVASRSFEQGVGGFNGVDSFDESGITVDFGARSYFSETASWEAQIVVGIGSAERDESSESIDAMGVLTDRFVLANDDIKDMTVGVYGGYNRLRREGLGETQYRAGFETTSRELDNDNLAYSETGGVVTPGTTLTGQDPVGLTRIYVSAQTVFNAGETELFAGARLAHEAVSGSTTIDVGGTPVNEAIDDTRLHLGLTVGLRQPLLRDRLRIIVSGRGDLFNDDTSTTFDSSSTSDDASRTCARRNCGTVSAWSARSETTCG